MTRSFLIVAGSVLALAWQSNAAPYTFTTISIPGAGGVAAYGINDAGTVVGHYFDAVGYHGFVDKSGKITIIDDPSGPPGSTILFGINDSGEMTGYDYGSRFNTGFVDIGGVFSPITDPLADNVNGTVPFSINDNGEISGYYYTADGTAHGFFDVGGTFTTIDDPAAGPSGSTVVFGVNELGELAGYFLNGTGIPHGFIDRGGIFTTIDDPLDPSGYAVSTGINDRGSTTGTYGSGVGYVIHGSTFTTVDGLQPDELEPFAINDHGTLAGLYVNRSGSIEGFIAKPSSIPEPATWAMVTLGVGGVGVRSRRRRARRVVTP